MRLIWLHLTLALAVRAFAEAIDATLRLPPSPLRSQRLDLNRARVAELALLPGLGPTRAQAIVLARVRHGPFRSVMELATVPGIGAGLIDRLRPFVAIDALTDGPWR